ncbi:hypothetical protein CRUP_032580, partial [Coryphaenoides rupestris]
TLFTACELGVFDLLLGSERPLSAEEISRAIGASLDGTQRLLDACTGLELLSAQQQGDGRVYRNTADTSRYLTQSSPVSLYHSIQYSSRTIYRCWYHLNDAVRSDEEMVKFMHLMNSIWNICGRDVVTAFDLSPFRSVYDLGGDFFKDPLPEGGGVLLVEAVLLEDGSGPLTAQLYSLNMLVQTEGRERTAGQYRALLGAAGFRPGAATPLVSCDWLPSRGSADCMRMSFSRTSRHLLSPTSCLSALLGQRGGHQ